MFTTFLKSLKRVTFVGGDEDNHSVARGLQGEEPKLNRFKDTGKCETDFHVSDEGTSRSTGQSQIKWGPRRKAGKVERCRAKGVITSWSTAQGVVDRKYQFSATAYPGLQEGDTVDFEAERRENELVWTVTSLKASNSDKESTFEMEAAVKKNMVKAQILAVDAEHIHVEVVADDSPRRKLRLPNGKGDKWMSGDWVEMEVGDKAENRDKSAIEPLQMKSLIGKVTEREGEYFVNDGIFYTRKAPEYPPGTEVCCTAIKSRQIIALGDFVEWRAVKVDRSNFSEYTSTDPDRNWLIDEKGESTLALHKELRSTRSGIEITPSSLSFGIQTIGSVAEKTITVANKSMSMLRLQKIFIRGRNNGESPNALFEIECYQLEADGGLTLLPNDEFQLNVKCTPTLIGRTSETCVFRFAHHSVLRVFSVIGRSQDELKLREAIEKENDLLYTNPTKVKKKSRDVEKEDVEKAVTDRERRCVKGVPTIRKAFFKNHSVTIRHYLVPGAMWQILKEKSDTLLRNKYPKCLSPLAMDSYKEKFMVTLWLEEMAGEMIRHQFDLDNIILHQKQTSGSSSYIFEAPTIQDVQPPVNTLDRVHVFDAKTENSVKFEGTVINIRDTEVTCVFGQEFDEKYTGFPVSVQFIPSRTNYRRCHHAVEMATDHLGANVLFPEAKLELKQPRIVVRENAQAASSTSDIHEDKGAAISGPLFHKAKEGAKFTRNLNSEDDSCFQSVFRAKRELSLRVPFVSDTASTPSSSSVKLEWYNRHLNKEQRTAVRRILNGEGRPAPYIIFGPPGTGKTITLVEAVMQLNKLDTNSRILVCAPSNSAVDVITECLVHSGEFYRGDFVRLAGFLRGNAPASKFIKSFSTDGENLAEVIKHRLIVSTCVTAGQFFALNLSEGHFTHVFIDEAGYCTEPETMVPAVLLATSKGGQLILAGDPQQLGPVIMSNAAENCGLKTSFLGRLMKLPLYSRDTDQFPEDKYNPLVLTKLVKNYRSHPTLLKLPSTTFYDGELISKGSYEETCALSEDPKLRDLLPKQGVPLIFHGVQGSTRKDPDSKSSYNTSEAAQVLSYVSHLKKYGLGFEDIGIITPYRKQVEKIRLTMQVCLSQDTELPKVGSVEEFQGGERKVIIISTVRSINENRLDSCLDSLSFIFEPERFNVAITRAKALMIVIGNPHVLARNKFWLQLLQYANELGCYKGCDMPVHWDEEMWELLNGERRLLRQNDDEGAQGGSSLSDSGNNPKKMVDDEDDLFL